MPSIPVETPLGYVSVFLIVLGIFLVITGLGVLKIEKLTVLPGRKTWGAGLVFLALGMIFLFPDIKATFTSTPHPTAFATPNNSTPSTTHCIKPTVPFLVYPGNNEVKPYNYSGQGQPWKFDWQDSTCEGGYIQGYRIIVICSNCQVPEIDKFVTGSEYLGDTTGTVSPSSSWIWKVQAVDDLNQSSDWSEERHFLEGE